jgi:WD40 repeat protein
MLRHTLVFMPLAILLVLSGSQTPATTLPMPSATPDPALARTYVYALDWSTDGTLYATGRSSGIVEVFRADGDLMAQFTVGTGAAVTFVAIDDRNQRIVAGVGETGLIEIVDLSTDARVTIARSSSDEWPYTITAVDWTSDGSLLAIAFSERPARGGFYIYDGRTGEVMDWYHVADPNCTRPQTGLRALCEITALAWNPDDRFIAAATNYFDAPLTLVDISTSEARVLNTDTAAQAITWSPDGDRLAISSYRLGVWDAVSGERLILFATDNIGRTTALAWNEAGTQIVTGRSDGSVSVWDAMTGALLATYDVGREQPMPVDWNWADDTIAYPDAEGAIVIVAAP